MALQGKVLFRVQFCVLFSTHLSDYSTVPDPVSGRIGSVSGLIRSDTVSGRIGDFDTDLIHHDTNWGGLSGTVASGCTSIGSGSGSGSGSGDGEDGSLSSPGVFIHRLPRRALV